MGMVILKFLTTVGEKREEIPISVPETTRMIRVVEELSKKLGLSKSSIAIAPHGGVALMSTQYNLTVKELVEMYGDRYSIINKGIVG